MDTNLEFLLEELRTRSGVIWGDFSGNPNENPTPVTENAPNDITWLVETSTATPSIWLKGGGSWIVIGTDLSSSIAAAQQALADTVVAKDVTLLAKAAAESARDAAQLSAGVYVDTAAGLAATTNGQYFSVPSADSAEYLILYKNNAGSAVEQKRYPSGEAVDLVLARLPPDAPPGYAWSVYDGDGSAAIGVLEDGTFRAESASLGEASATEMTADVIGTATGKMQDASTAGHAWSIEDAEGLTAIGVRDDGTFDAKAIVTETINGVAVEDLGGGRAAYSGSYKYEINHVISYGQSLSLGTASTPPISTAQRFDNLKFAGGVRAQDAGSDPAVKYASLQPLTETESGTDGETPCSGFSDAVKELVLAENLIAYADQTYQFLCSAPGSGATTIANLSKGTASYMRLTDDVTYGFSLAGSANKFAAVPAFLWVQGEADQNAGTTKAVYKTALDQLIADISTDVKAITGQTEHVICIMYQTSSCTAGQTNNGVIPHAQRDVANSNANAYMACPMYFLDYVSGGRHVTAESSKWFGAYMGLVFKRVVVDGEQWSPVQPTQAFRQGSIAVVKFNVPRPPLRIDTSQVAATTNYGFKLADSGGTPIAINSVSIIGPDTVKIIAASAIPAGAKLTYATDGTTASGRLTGPRGNLRDSQGDDIVFDGGGLNLPMHNWCITFEETLA